MKILSLFLIHFYSKIISNPLINQKKIMNEIQIDTCYLNFKIKNDKIQYLNFFPHITKISILLV